jgi:hypothetical protein
MLHVLRMNVAKVDRDVAHVVRVCSKCFIYFFVLCCSKCFHVASFQVFHVDVAYVAMAIHVCCKCIVFECFSCFKRMLHVCLFGCCICLEVFHPDVAYVSHIYCKCFIWILHMFCNGYTHVSLVFHTYIASVSINSDIRCRCLI